MVILAVLPVFCVAAAGDALGPFNLLHSRTPSALNIDIRIHSLIDSSLPPSELDWTLFAEFFPAATVLVGV